MVLCSQTGPPPNLPHWAIQTDRQTDRQTITQTDNHTDRQSHRQTITQTDRQAQRPSHTPLHHFPTLTNTFPYQITSPLTPQRIHNKRHLHNSTNSHNPSTNDHLTPLVLTPRKPCNYHRPPRRLDDPTASPSTS